MKFNAFTSFSQVFFYPVNEMHMHLRVSLAKSGLGVTVVIEPEMRVLEILFLDAGTAPLAGLWVE